MAEQNPKIIKIPIFPGTSRQLESHQIKVGGRSYLQTREELNLKVNTPDYRFKTFTKDSKGDLVPYNSWYEFKVRRIPDVELSMDYPKETIDRIMDNILESSKLIVSTDGPVMHHAGVELFTIENGTTPRALVEDSEANDIKVTHLKRDNRGMYGFSYDLHPPNMRSLNVLVEFSYDLKKVQEGYLYEDFTNKAFYEKVRSGLEASVSVKYANR